jgi:glycosyltransferase involved in cell wall biosynthesis
VHRTTPKFKESSWAVLFIAMHFPPFIQNDVKFLEKEYAVRCFRYVPSRKILPNLWQQIRLLNWLPFRMQKVKAIYVWFADYHAFLPVLFSKILRKKSIVVLAGYDVTSIPRLNYGVFSNPIRSFCAAFAIRNADILAPVAGALIDSARKRVPEIRGRIVPIPFGFDPSQWYCDTPKEDMVLTVSIADDETRIQIKGVDFLMEVARRLPEVSFVVVGVCKRTQTLLDAPSNVRFFERILHSELRRYYSRAKVYAQFSLSEGMPNVVCEAMLCECIPVGTKTGGIPEIIGDAGYLISDRILSSVVCAIRSALKAPRNMREKARDRVVTHFSEQNRYRALVGIIEGSVDQ